MGLTDDDRDPAIRRLLHGGHANSTAWAPIPMSWSPVDWAHGGAVPDPARVLYPGPNDPSARTERLLRQALARYSLSWRQAHGEQFVTDELVALGAQGFEGTRLPESVGNELKRQASGHERFRRHSRWGLLWFTLTGRGGGRLDRWLARDALLDGTWAMYSSREALVLAIGVAIVITLSLTTVGRLVTTPVLLFAIVASHLVVMGFEWTSAFRRLRAARLRQLDFTEAGVPLEWLPPPPHVVAQGPGTGMGGQAWG